MSVPSGLQPTPEVLGAILRGEVKPAEREDDKQVNGEDLEQSAGADREPEVPPPADETGGTPGDGVEAQKDGAEAESSATEGESEGEQAPGEAAETRLTISDLAARLEMEPSELYDQLEVPLSDNRGSVTIDELKAGYLGQARLEDAREQLDLEREEHSKRTTEVDVRHLRDRRELQMLLPYVQQLPPELIQRAQQMADEYQRNEADSLFAARPDWRAPGEFDAVRERLYKRLSEYGFERAEWYMVQDHRLVLVADRLDTLERERDQALAKLREAREGAKPKEPRTPRRPSADAHRARLTKAARRAGATDADRAAAVADLLRNRQQ